jgi:hypothetical protein
MSEPKSPGHTVRHHFTASEQLAIQFVLKYIANPAGVPKSNWEQPSWGRHFTWFTKIICTRVQKVEDTQGFKGEEAVTRVIIFRLATVDVVKITMFGVRSGTFINWAVQKVEYRPSWSDDCAWTEQEMPIGSLHGLPTLVAPAG